MTGNSHLLYFIICHLIGLSSTCINPVLYGLLNDNIAAELSKLQSGTIYMQTHTDVISKWQCSNTNGESVSQEEWWKRNSTQPLFAAYGIEQAIFLTILNLCLKGPVRVSIPGAPE